MAAEHRALPARPWDRGKVGASVPGAMSKPPRPHTNHPSTRGEALQVTQQAACGTWHVRVCPCSPLPLLPPCRQPCQRRGATHRREAPAVSRESGRKPASILSACQYQPGLGLAGSSPPGTKLRKQLHHEPQTKRSRPGGRPPLHPNCLGPAGQVTVQLGAEGQPSGPSLPSKEPLRSCATGGKRCLEDPKK